jgi:hypothetical protein
MRQNVSLLWPQNCLLANSCIYLIDSISDYISVFALEVGLIHSQPSQVSGWLPVLISCCCLIWPNLVVIFQFVLTLVNARHEWNQAKISCLVTFGNWAMFSCALFWSTNSFPVDSKPCDYLCLLSLLVWRLFLQPIGATWDFTFIVRLVMVLWVATDGAATKPRASYGCRHMAGCLAHAGIMVSSHDPLSNDNRCVIFSCSFLGYLSISYRKIRISDRK